MIYSALNFVVKRVRDNITCSVRKPDFSTLLAGVENPDFSFISAKTFLLFQQKMSCKIDKTWSCPAVGSGGFWWVAVNSAGLQNCGRPISLGRISGFRTWNRPRPHLTRFCFGLLFVLRPFCVHFGSVFDRFGSRNWTR